MNANAAQPLEIKSAKIDPVMQKAVYAAVEEADLTSLPGWDAVSDLAPEVYPESIVVYVEGMIIDGSDVSVPADLTLLLVYEEGGSKEPVEFQDNYPTQLKFKQSKSDGRLSLTSIKISA